MNRYIDAEWLLNFFEPYPDDYQTPLGTLRACVDDAPSIDIDRPQGKWVNIYQLDSDGRMMAQCSNCREKIYFYGSTPNFCQHCGVDMR